MDGFSDESLFIFLLVSCCYFISCFISFQWPCSPVQLLLPKIFSESEWNEPGAEAINWGPIHIRKLCDLGTSPDICFQFSHLKIGCNNDYFM